MFASDRRNLEEVATKEKETPKKPAASTEVPAKSAGAAA